MSGASQKLRAAPATAARAKKLRRKPSASEGALWAELRKLNLGISRQAPLGPYVIDFVHHPSRLAVDIDRGGPDKHLNREFWLQEAGYRVVRIKESAVRDHLSKVVEQIAAETQVPPPQISRPQGPSV